MRRVMVCLSVVAEVSTLAEVLVDLVTLIPEHTVNEDHEDDDDEDDHDSPSGGYRKESDERIVSAPRVRQIRQ